MNVQVQSIHFTADAKLLEYVEKKLEKLTKFNENIVDTKVMLKLENSGQVRDKIVELVTKIPGDTIIIKSEDKSFEVAFDQALDSMKRQLKRHKEKILAKKRLSSNE